MLLVINLKFFRATFLLLFSNTVQLQIRRLCTFVPTMGKLILKLTVDIPALLTYVKE